MTTPSPPRSSQPTWDVFSSFQIDAPPDIKYEHCACLLLLTDDGMSWRATRLAVTKSRQDTRPPHSAAAAA